MDMYSEEWKQVVNTFEEYRKCLSVFRNYNNKTEDLSKALHSNNIIDCYYALEALRFMPDDTCIQLLDDLFYVLIYSNDSFSSYSKDIILRVIDDKLVKDIAELANKYAHNTTSGEDIKAIAQLLFECKSRNSLYNEIYVLFSRQYFQILLEEEFFDSEDDYKDLIII